MLLDQFRKFIVLLFSFFLAFGKYDPFGTQGLYLDVVLVIVILTIGLSTNVINHIHLFRKQIILLSGISIVLLICSLIYGQVYSSYGFFNFKYLSAIIIFWFLSYYFKIHQKERYYSLLLFAVASSIIAAFYQLGYFDNVIHFDKGRLIIFEENPNSFSSRMAIAFLINVYMIVFNPLNLKKVRYVLLFTLPSLFLVIVDAGSKGSFFALLFGVALMLFLKRTDFVYKVVLIALIGLVGLFLVQDLQDTVLLERLSEEQGLGEREAIWSNALSIFSDYPFGVGESGFFLEMGLRYSKPIDAHNLFIYLLATGGFISLILFLLFLRTLYFKSYYLLKRKGDVFFLAIFLFIIFLASKTGGVFTYLVMWYLFAIINSIGQRKVV